MRPDPTNDLTSREREILRLVVKSFIHTAGPVGSRYLSKQSSLGLSAASIRNTMSDLEEQGYLDHPYTSAGRIPTALGYRVFVDQLMESSQLTEMEKQRLVRELERMMGDTDQLVRESSRLLGQLSSLIGVVVSPRLSEGVLERLEAVPLSSSRLMVVISVRGGLVRTLIVEVESTVRRDDLDRVLSLINERLAGLTLEEIRRTYADRIGDLRDDETGIIRLILNEPDRLFSEHPQAKRLALSSAQHLLEQPEFQEPEAVREIVQFLEDEAGVIAVLESRLDRTLIQSGEAVVSIGRERGGTVDYPADRYSIVTSEYRRGDTSGTVAVIGPMRMDYARVVALVEGMAACLDNPSTSD
ncbi:MAG: heat-inducible transcriptional repressor HrcA [Bacteroidota bacterium]